MIHASRWLPSLRLRYSHRDDTPYIAEYAPAGSDTANPELDAFAGIILVHTAEHEDHRKVITYWRSREHFDRDGVAFGRAIGTPVSWHGHVRDYRERRERFLKRFPWYTALIAVIAILGALESGRIFFHRLFAAPVLNTWFAYEGDSNYLPNDPIDEVLQITNHVPAEERIEVTNAAFRGRGTVLRPVYEPRIPELRENETVPIKFSTRIGTPGEYILKVDLRVRAGRFHDIATVTATRSLVVWSRGPVVVSKNIAQIRGDACVISCEIRVGNPAPRGLAIDVRLLRHPEISEAMVTLPGARVTDPWKISAGAGAEVSTFTVTTQPVPAFQRLNFAIVLAGSMSTSWNDVIEHLDIEPHIVGQEGMP